MSRWSKEQLAARARSAKKWRDANLAKARAEARARRLADPEFNAKRRAKYALDPRNVLAQAKRYRTKHPERVRGRLRRRNYGVTPEQFESMRAKQEGACAICREGFVRTPYVDHDHATGAARDLLCNACNIGLGHFKDDPTRLESAAAYIRRHRAPRLTLARSA